MSLTQAQVQFAAEFITLVVTASALALVLLRGAVGSTGQPAVRRRRRLVAAIISVVSLAVLGAASFVHGSLLVAGGSVKWVGVGRLAAASILALGFPYPGGPDPDPGRPRLARVVLRCGLLLWALAGVAELTDAAGYPTDASLVAGSALVAIAALRAAQRSIAVRVAASAASTLLLVVIVVALALSTVISSSAQRAELRRLSARAGVEKAALTDTGPLAFAARLVEADLSGYFSDQAANPLQMYATGTTAQRAAAAGRISARLSQLSASVGPGSSFGELSYADAGGSGGAGVVGAATPSGSTPPLTGSDPILTVSCTAGRQGLFQSGGRVWLGASSPECTSAGGLLGVVVVARPVDDRYLAARVALDPSVSIAVISGRAVVASSGIAAKPALSVMPSETGPVGRSVSQTVGDRFVNATVVAAQGPGGTSRLDLLVVSPATSVLSARQQLFRTLFLIAFGGTVVALGLAVFTGDRITAGVRRLTRAASDIQAGHTTVRAGVAGEDEVAVLGSAFDAMLDSVSAHSGALQAAAEDETRLRNRLEAVVAGMTDALVALDVYGRVIEYNRAAAHLAGVDPSEALGSPVEQVIHLRDEQGEPVGRDFFLAGGQDQAMMGRIDCNAEQVPVAVSRGALLDPDGGPAGTVLVLRDMRREHEVERMKTEFLSRVGHELRTPLTGIMGYADILVRREVPPERARSWYEEILQSARRLLRIVEMLEFFASEGAGRLVLRPEPVDVRALVSGITASWAGRLPANVSLGRRLTRSQPVIPVDRRWLSTAIDELIDNAVKFSPQGGRILVRVVEDGGSVEISVTDQGLGMTAEQSETVFDQFVQADNSDTRRFGGLGLGLAVVRRVVEGHGGWVRVRSTPGRGSTFAIELPVRPTGDAGGDSGPRNASASSTIAPTERTGPSATGTSPTRQGAGP